MWWCEALDRGVRDGETAWAPRAGVFGAQMSGVAPRCAPAPAMGPWPVMKGRLDMRRTRDDMDV